MSEEIGLNKDQIPEHIAIIMDGNGRWAKMRGKPRVFGHRSAIKAVRETVESCAEIGVKNLTLYAFSTENWKRPRLEVTALMELLVNSLNKELKTLTENNIRLITIGDTASLPRKCQKSLDSVVQKTASNTRMNLILALSYSSRWEIVNAAKTLAQNVVSGKLKTDEINEEIFSQTLSTSGIPDPELMIRTSGEHRISNFLLWQLAYAELVFIDKFWPEFRKGDLLEAIKEYQRRERRFGMTGEQISAN